MSKQSRSSRAKHAWRSEGPDGQSAGSSARTAPQDELSFLSLKNAVGSYPDTGESGDAYDVENDRRSVTPRGLAEVPSERQTDLLCSMYIHSPSVLSVRWLIIR
jgi:hypothetical protein